MNAAVDDIALEDNERLSLGARALSLSLSLSLSFFSLSLDECPGDNTFKNDDSMRDPFKIFNNLYSSLFFIMLIANKILNRFI